MRGRSKSEEFAIRVIDYGDAKRIAHIMGSGSAHAHAIADFDERSRRGEDPIIGYRCDGVVIVVPRAFTRTDEGLA